MRGLRFIARAACAMPHPEKVSRGGEDGFFLASDGRTLGVADGVGGWADQGVNPAFFTWNFMRRCLFYTTQGAPGSRPPIAEVLQNAWADTVRSRLQGSCTMATASFEGPALAGEAPMTVMLVGDCGAVVLRDGEVVLRTKERQYKFNFPHQIGSDGASSPQKLAAREEVAVRPKDVVILGTDGVFDNVYDHDLVALVKKATAEAGGDGSAIDCQKLADAVAQTATSNGASSTYRSPFSVAASKAGYRYLGGKQDDVCVVVGVVGEAELDAMGGAGKPPPYSDVESYFAWAKKPCAKMPATAPAGKL